MRAACKVLLAAAVCYASIVWTMGGMQRRLTYFPSAGCVEDLVPLARRLGLEPLWIGGTVAAWATPAAASVGNRLLVFHGNAGFALDRSYFLPLPGAADSWQVILAEYPGYGSRSAEEPSERSLSHAAETLFAHLLTQADGPIYIAGESIGSGVAASLAGSRPNDVAGLVLITPMPSLVEVALHHYPWLPVRRLLSDRYDSVRALRGYGGRVAFVLAENDEVIPAALGRKLYEAYGGPKRLWIQQGRSHNTVDYDPAWWVPVFAFVTALPST